MSMRRLGAVTLTSRHQISYITMMRTTLTIDDDLAAMLSRMRRERDVGLKQLINEALRRGLAEMAKPNRRKPFRTRTVDAGRLLIGSIDNIGDVLASLDDEKFR